MDIFKQILLQLVLIALNAFFAATEIALLSLNEKKVRNLAEDGDKKAAKLLKIIEDPTKFLSAIQIGITLAGFLGSAFAADNFAERLTGFLVRKFDISSGYVGVIDTLSVIAITLILSYFTLVLGELVPKRVAMKHKEKLAGATVSIMSGLAVILKPIIWFLTASTNVILRLFGINPKEKDETVSEEDIVIMLDAGADEGTLDTNDIEYIKNVFKLSELTVSDVMTPRPMVVAAPKDASREELMRIIDEEGYSRIPIYEGDIDNTVGILHTRKYLLHNMDEDFKIEDVLLEPEYIPGNAHLDVVFQKMQKNHTHLVLAVDEYGSVQGVLSMEDILEEIVGDIWDEQDEETAGIVEVDENTYTVPANLARSEFFEHFNLPENEEITSATVNGWICEICESIPEVGYTFDYENLTITVTKATELLTEEISVFVKQKTEEEPEEETKE